MQIMLGLAITCLMQLKADQVGTGKGLTGFAGSVPNPHVKASDWGWQIDPSL